MSNRLTLTFAERAELSPSPLTQRLFNIMSTKESNICVAIDETDPRRFLALVEALGPEVAVVKTHIDILEGFTSRMTVDLTSLAHEMNFMIFEDRKFADIGQTVKDQYTKGVFHIVEWADIVNAHTLPGPGIIAGLRSEVETHGLLDKRGLLLLAQMSPKGNLIDDAYTTQTVKMAEENRDFVIGFIGAGEKLSDLAAQAGPEFIIFTPGVKLEGKGDDLGQNYLTPDKLVADGADLLVVGRDIVADAKPKSRAKLYRELGWQAYQKRITAPKVSRAEQDE